MKRLTIYMDDSVHKQIKILCASEEKSMNEFIVGAAVKELVAAIKKEKVKQ